MTLISRGLGSASALRVVWRLHLSAVDVRVVVVHVCQDESGLVKPDLIGKRRDVEVVPRLVAIQAEPSLDP